jgi:hypothetical protein
VVNIGGHCNCLFYEKSADDDGILLLINYICS